MLGNDPPDLLITDGDMPEMGGLELCRRLRAQGASLPVIFITASADQLVDALDAGADDFVRKPFEPAELAARVRAALRARHLAGQLAAERAAAAAAARAETTEGGGGSGTSGSVQPVGGLSWLLKAKACLSTSSPNLEHSRQAGRETGGTRVISAR